MGRALRAMPLLACCRTDDNPSAPEPCDCPCDVRLLAEENFGVEAPNSWFLQKLRVTDEPRREQKYHIGCDAAQLLLRTDDNPPVCRTAELVALEKRL